MNAIKMVAVAACFLIGEAAQAKDYSGLMLYPDCGERGPQSLGNLACIAYVHGLLDGMLLGESGRLLPARC